MQARHMIVTGRVQGVGFRWYTMRLAHSLGLTGWVRNRHDGSVEVWAEGDLGMLEELESALKTGPPGSLVRDLKAEPSTATGTHMGFEVTF